MNMYTNFGMKICYCLHFNYTQRAILIALTKILDKLTKAHMPIYGNWESTDMKVILTKKTPYFYHYYVAYTANMYSF